MPDFKFVKKLAVLAGLIIIPIAVFLLPNFASAGFLDFSINEVLMGFLSVIVDMIGYALITLAAGIVNFAFSFQHFVEVPMVQVGWTLVRDLANMAFILIMLAVAFSTILQFDTYGWKKIIPKLVIAALTINFSLLICGIIIDFGNSLAMFFISGGTPGGPAEVGTNIMAAARAGAIAQLRNGAEANFMATFAAVVMQLIFYIALAFMLLAIGIIMIYRILTLWILVIVSPAAWVGNIINPSYFKNWWKKFINLAVVFPIAMSFFVFLSLVIGSTFKQSEGLFNNIGTTNSAWSYIFPDTAFSVIMQFLVVLSFLGYGLSFATKTGTAGGAMVVKWAGTGKNWAMGKLKAAPRTGAGITMRGVDKVTGGAATRGLTAGLERLERAPLIGRAIGGPGAHFQRQQKEIKKAEGELKGLRPQDLRAILNQVAITPAQQARKAAALSQLADKGQLKDEDKKHIQDFQAAGGNLNDIIKKRLDWALDERIQQIMASDLNNPKMAGDWSKVTAEKEPAKRLAAVKKLIRDEYIPKKPGELADIQKDAIDAKESDEIKGKKKILRLNAERSTEQLDKQVEDIQKVINVEKAKGADANKKFIAEREATIENINDLRKESRKESLNEYLRELDRLEQEEAEKLGQGNQKIIRELILEEFKEEGRLYATSLNSLAGKNPGAYQELSVNYLKYRAVGMEESLKKDVYKHLTSSPIAAIAEETPPPTPAIPGTTP